MLVSCKYMQLGQLDPNLHIRNFANSAQGFKYRITPFPIAPLTSVLSCTTPRVHKSTLRRFSSFPCIEFRGQEAETNDAVAGDYRGGRHVISDV